MTSNPVADRAAMRSRRTAAVGAALVVSLVLAATLNPAGQAHAAELVAGTGSEVSLDQLEAPAEQQVAAQQADAAAAAQPDATVRLTSHGPQLSSMCDMAPYVRRAHHYSHVLMTRLHVPAG